MTRVAWISLLLLLAASCRSHEDRPRAAAAPSLAVPSSISSALAASASAAGSAEDLDSTCDRCDPETKRKYQELFATGMILPAEGGLKIFLRGERGRTAWGECGVHSGDLIVRIAGHEPNDLDVPSAFLAKTCATKGKIESVSREAAEAERSAALCKREPSRAKAWVERCQKFQGEFRAAEGDQGASLYAIAKQGGPWRCGLRNGDRVTQLGGTENPGPDQLGVLYDACTETTIRLVVSRKDESLALRGPR